MDSAGWAWCKRWLEHWPPEHWHQANAGDWNAAHYHQQCDRNGPGRWTPPPGQHLVHRASWSKTVASVSRLNGSRLIFFGDSLSLEHWLHTICILASPARARAG
eukprot:7390202-Prymnesium_polylepis.2